jgi:hypothetical protein
MAMCAPIGALGLLSADSAVVGERKRCITASAANQDCARDGNEDSDEETIADDDHEPPWVRWDRQATNYCDFWSERAAAAAARGLSPEDKSSDDVPAMPCMGDSGGPLPPMGLASDLEPHRPNIAPRHVPFNALVARPVNKVDIARTSAAKAAMDSEWKRLIDKRVWDVDSVREWRDVAAEASRKKTEVQFGFLFGIRVEKNAELPADHPSRKFKGPVVFQGNRVVNQNWEAAVFQDMGNSPVTMDASHACDCYGSMPGNKTEIADSEQAYIQADLQGNDCWICLPPEARKPAWAHFVKPVVSQIAAPFGRSTVMSMCVRWDCCP